MRKVFLALGLLAGFALAGTAPATANVAGAAAVKPDIAKQSNVTKVHRYRRRWHRRRWHRHRRWYRPRFYFGWGYPAYYGGYYYRPRYRYRRWGHHRRWHGHRGWRHRGWRHRGWRRRW